jgi:hypothetical protein
VIVVSFATVSTPSLQFLTALNPALREFVEEHRKDERFGALASSPWQMTDHDT